MKLTIAMPCYNNFTEVFFTVQALRMYHNMKDTQILIIDNFGDDLTMNFARSIGATYERYTEIKGSAPAKNRVFDVAKGEYVLCMDSHVLLSPDSLSNLPVGGDLYHGPLLYDDYVNYCCDLLPVWRGEMWGIWGENMQNPPRQHNIKQLPKEPFEIWGHGMGLFFCRKDAWVGFNPKFKGFGAEEGYIHEKFRKAGKKVICWPSLVWTHFFTAGKKTPPYLISQVDKIRNYIIGFTELGLSVLPIKEHFKEEAFNKALAINLKKL